MCAADNPRNVFSALAVLKKKIYSKKESQKALEAWPQQAMPPRLPMPNYFY